MPYADPQRQREYQREWIAERRREWLEGKSCVVCGSMEKLEIDHIDGSQKVSHRVWSWTPARRDAELEKCQVLCMPHHWDKTRRDLYPLIHGKHGTYTWRGCRCRACKSAHAETNREWRSKQRDVA